MPVLPEVGSMITPPGLSLPDRSASSTIESAIRSLIDPPGFARSCLIQTSARSPNRRLIRTCGVLPIVSRILAAFTHALLCLWLTQIGWFEALCKPQLWEPPRPEEHN